MVATSLLGYFGTSLLIDSLATGLRLIACTCMGYLNNIYIKDFTKISKAPNVKVYMIL